MKSILIRCLLSFIFLISKYTECSVVISQGRESTIHIDLDDIKYNYEQLVKKLPQNHPVMAVVKANAYGVGAVAVSNVAVELGAKYLGVAFVDEGVYLRMHGITAPILVLGYTAPSGIDLAIRNNITLAVYTREVLSAIQRKAWYNETPVKIHIKVNTGMNRIGMEPEEVVPFVKSIKNGFYPKVEVEGIFSHFASLSNYPILSESDKQYARDQLNTFKRVVNLARQVINIPIAHMATSNSIEFFGEEAFLDMVRPGSSISGFMSFTKTAISLTSIVSAIRKPRKGQQIGYEVNTTVTGNDWIATVPLGYADGLRPDCSNGREEVLLNGKRVPIVSGIMMDQLLLNATNVYPIRVGEEVVFIGRQRQEEITALDISKRCGGTELSLTSQLSRRIPRVYHRNNRVVYYENYLLQY